MFQNYFKIAWRNLVKNKVFSLINILGLTIGITVCMMIFLFIMNEFSADRFHANGKNIYRVMRGSNGSKERAPWLSGPYAPALLNDFKGEVKQAVRVSPTNGLVTFGNTSFSEKKMYMADEDFFTMFSFKLIKGNAATALKEPGSIVLTESTAKKYFGNEDPIGKILTVDKQLRLAVTGVAADVPTNSHLYFDAVIPISNYYSYDWFKAWANNSLFTYILLDAKATQQQIEKRFPAFVDKYMGKDLQQYARKTDLALVPLNDVYFQEASPFDKVKHGDKKVVYIFISIAVLIMLIACINFTNLSTIRAVERSKEVGMRKVMGAEKRNLMWQFVGESILLTVLSCAFSVVLLQMLMPVYNQVLGNTLTIPWNAAAMYIFIAGVILFVGFLAGSYPAFFLSAFSPIQALKGKLKLGKGGSVFRHSLVIFQFSISVLLIIGTIVISNQMSYVKDKELGYDKEHAVVVPITNDDFYNHLQSFKNELQTNASVASVSIMSGEPGGFFDSYDFDVEGQQQPLKASTEFADFEFVKTLGLKIIAGRDLSAEYPTDTLTSAIINRTAAKQLNLSPEQAIGKWIKNPFRDSLKRKIVGVIEDFNYQSLKANVDALVISPNDDRRVAVIKLKAGNVQSSLDAIKKVYNKSAPDYPFEYSFLDQKFDELYKEDLRQQKILSVFSGLAIFIACMGLFGLASFTATKRTKEIGIRKAVGSSTENIVLLLSKDLLIPVLAATCIGIPVAYYIMYKWLQSFAYRTPLHWWIFLLAAAVVVGIAVFSVSFKAVKAALANPIKSLRTE